MKIDLAVLKRQYLLHAEEYEAAALRALRSGWYILGEEGKAFEREFSEYTGAKYCVGLNSGLDALTLAMRALGIGTGDEVIVPANTYIATVLAITANGATPIFVEPDVFYNLDADELEKNLSERTKAVMVVHLYGQAANMDRIQAFAKKYDLFLVEDCAQSHGASFAGTMTGRFGDIGCFSFFPTKNLGAFGDAGAIVTDDAAVYEKIAMLRNYGSREKYHNELAGVNSRLDEMQAALLRVKLKHLDELNRERQRLAAKYLSEIHNPQLLLPAVRAGATHVYHQFVIQCEMRDDLQRYLKEHEIDTIIHYPIPPHLAVCYKELGHHVGDFPIAEKYASTVLSLPIYNGMTEQEQEYVIEVLNKYARC